MAATSIYCQTGGHQRCAGKHRHTDGTDEPCDCPCHTPIIGKADVVECPSCGQLCTGGTGYSSHVRNKHRGRCLPAPKHVGSTNDVPDQPEKPRASNLVEAAGRAVDHHLIEDGEALAFDLERMAGRVRRWTRKASAVRDLA